MPGLYAKGDFDLAGFAVGAAERGTLLPRGGLKAGDLVIGLPSSGVHSNGFSLVRRIVERSRARPGTRRRRSNPAARSRDALLTPTRLYVKPLLAALKAAPGVLALAHITGGGFPDNLPRVLPDSLGVELDLAAFAPQPVFSLARRRSAASARPKCCAPSIAAFGMVAFAAAASESETVARRSSAKTSRRRRSGG